jgi:hypothetical protein
MLLVHNPRCLGNNEEAAGITPPPPRAPPLHPLVLHKPHTLAHDRMRMPGRLTLSQN